MPKGIPRRDSPSDASKEAEIERLKAQLAEAQKLLGAQEVEAPAEPTELEIAIQEAKAGKAAHLNESGTKIEGKGKYVFIGDPFTPGHALKLGLTYIGEAPEHQCKVYVRPQDENAEE